MSNSNIKNLLVDHNETIRNALKKINLSGLKVCFLVKNNKLKNVISDGDIRRSLLKSLELSDKVKYVKSKKFIYVQENYDFLDLQNKISKYGIVPILNKKGRLHWTHTAPGRALKKPCDTKKKWRRERAV